MDKYAVLALCFLLVFQGVTQLIVISRATDYSVWRYHKVLTVSNSTALPAGYQLNFTLWKGVGVDSADNIYLNNHASDNLFDIRFVDGNGELLDMWNQTAITGENHVHVWIELASSLIVVMYYGNEYASSEWDGATAVFERVVDTGLVCALPMDGDLEDYSGYGNDGVESGGAVFVDGRFGYGLSYDGVDDVVTVADNSSLDVEDLGVVMYFKAYNVADRHELFSKGFTSFDCNIWAGAVWDVRLNSGAVELYAGTVLNNTEYVLSVSYNQSILVMYANGSVVDSDSYAVALVNNANDLLVGTTEEFFGVVSGFFMFDRALSVAEVADFNSYYPQVFSNHLGSIYLREWATGVSSSSSTETDSQSTDVTTEQDVNWMAFIVLLAFAFLNVVLILVPRVYVVNFVVAALTLAFSAATVNDSMLPIQPYFSLIVALLAVLGILRAANLVRNS